MKPASLGNGRQVAAASLALIGAYVVAVGLESVRAGVPFDAVELFPLGSASDAPLIARGMALIVGLVLGWGVPGLSLAILMRAPSPAALATLGRAFGLGFGYILLTSVGYAVLTGHAPPRTVFLILLSLPSIPALWSRDFETSNPRVIATAGAALLAMAVVTAALWPQLHQNSLNGDGTEIYELSRSLESHAFPRWDLEDERGGRFGIPVVAPYITGAYFTFGEMTILGCGELAARIPFVLSLVLVAVTAISVVRSRSWLAWFYVVTMGAVFALWHTYYVTYEPPFPELAAAAGSDMLTIALWLAGFREVVTGTASLGVAFMLMASGVRYAAPVLTALALVAVWLTDRAKGRAFLRSTVVAAASAVIAVALLAWLSGDWDHWVRQIRDEYLEDYTATGGNSGWWLLRSLVLMTGALPLIAIIRWRNLGALHRALVLIGLAYLGVVLAGGEKHLHYLTPLPWIFLPAAIEAANGRWRLATAGAIAVLSVTFALSWPSAGFAREENKNLGRESCVQGFDYETASLRSGGIYSALNQPPRTQRFAVGKHTFVRYAIDLGGSDCVLGLSPSLPEGAVALVDRPAMLWTMDPDRYAAWRFRQVAAPSSVLFPFSLPEALPVRAADWTGRLDLSSDRGRALVVSTSQDDNAALMTSLRRTRLLVPTARAHSEFVAGVSAAAAGSLIVSANGEPAVTIALTAGEQVVVVRTGLRAGWNILAVDGGTDVTFRWFEVR